MFDAGKPYSPVHKGMLFTEDAENVTISGEGQVDGNGDVFFELDQAKKLSRDDTKFTRQKDNFRRVAEGIGDGPIVPKDRPYQMFVFSNCKAYHHKGHSHNKLAFLVYALSRLRCSTCKRDTIVE